MRFKNRQAPQQMPILNLVPMLDVLMTVLTFFIIVAMSLSLEQGVDIELPSREASASPPLSPAPLVVQLDATGQIRLNNTPSTYEELASQTHAYLMAHAEGVVILQADPDLPYEHVIDLLTDLKDIGGDRVSLAIE